MTQCPTCGAENETHFCPECDVRDAWNFVLDAIRAEETTFYSDCSAIVRVIRAIAQLKEFNRLYVQRSMCDFWLSISGASRFTEPYAKLCQRGDQFTLEFHNEGSVQISCTCSEQEVIAQLRQMIRPLLSAV